MPTQDRGEGTIGEQINDLYWNSSRTVDEIISELDVSRNTLYSSVQPVPAGATCTVCGNRLLFTNRTNRSAAIATCRECGAERRIDEAELDGGPIVISTGGGGADAYEAERSWTRWRGDIGAIPRERVALIGGAAVLGVVLGAAAARAIRG